MSETEEAAPTEELPALGADLEWRFVPSEVEEWAKLSHDEIKARIAEKLDKKTSFRDDVISDFHLFNMVHAQSICLSTTQTAIWMSIMALVLEKLSEKSETCKFPGDSCQYSEVFERFQTLLMAHCGNTNTVMFSLQEARLLVDFSTLTFFKHFLLYQYCLVFGRETEIMRVGLEMQTPVSVLPLSSAKMVPRSPPKPTIVPVQYTRVVPEPVFEEETENITIPPALQNIIDQKINAAEVKFVAKIDELKGTMK